MSGTKEPFVSGLPGGDAKVPPSRDELAAGMVTALRDRAREGMAALKPATVERFDGVERIKVEPDVLAEFTWLETLDRLLSGILADPVALSRASSILRGEAKVRG